MPIQPPFLEPIVEESRMLTRAWLRFFQPRRGTTAKRPELSIDDAGYDYFDTDIKKYVIWTGTAWDIPNTDVSYAGFTIKYSAAPYPGSVTTRALNTTYQNTSGKQIFVRVVAYSNSNTGLYGYADTSNPPTTVVDFEWQIAGEQISSGFPVLPGEYYRTVLGGTVTLQYWVEWY